MTNIIEQAARVFVYERFDLVLTDGDIVHELNLEDEELIRTCSIFADSQNADLRTALTEAEAKVAKYEEMCGKAYCIYLAFGRHDSDREFDLIREFDGERFVWEVRNQDGKYNTLLEAFDALKTELRDTEEGK